MNEGHFVSGRTESVELFCHGGKKRTLNLKSLEKSLFLPAPGYFLCELPSPLTSDLSSQQKKKKSALCLLSFEPKSGVDFCGLFRRPSEPDGQ